MSCGGTQYNPFAQEDDGLGVAILKKMAKKIDYRYENGRNEMTVVL